MRIASIQSFYLAPDVVGYIQYQSESLKLSRSAIVEMMVRYIASQDTQYIGDKEDANFSSNIDDQLQYSSVSEDDFIFNG